MALQALFLFSQQLVVKNLFIEKDSKGKGGGKWR